MNELYKQQESRRAGAAAWGGVREGEKNSRSCAHKSIHTDSFVNGAMNAQMREREGVRKTERE